jgi:AAA+ superfamily predicted ATPase
MRWGAILLLDEADVLLEARAQSDIRRNALVSVVLRVLEYSQGIIIMTSNRVGTFDEALISRISLSVLYPAFNGKTRQCIFEYFIDRLDSKVKFNRDHLLDSFLKISNSTRFNGRQIRNVVSLALSLAGFAAAQTGEKSSINSEVHLNRHHISQACDMTMAIDRYMQEVMGADEFARARESAIR